MATLIDHERRTRTNGTVDNLSALMVNALITSPKRHHKPANVRRYCESSVRAAIRRGGMTDARQELQMSDSERAEWEAANPLPE